MAEINNVIAEASQDLQTIEDFVNLPADSEVYPRLLPSVNVGTLAGTRQAIFEAGGLPATPFATKALMEASALVDGQYAIVTDDEVASNNDVYIKNSGVWAKTKYDPAAAAIEFATQIVTDIYSNKKRNMLDVSSLITGQYINSVGDIVSNAIFNTSQYILVKPNTQYTVSCTEGQTGVQDISFFDSKKNFISRVSLSYSTGATPHIQQIQTPKNASYINANVSNTKVNNNLMINEGGYQGYTAYEPPIINNVILTDDYLESITMKISPYRFEQNHLQPTVNLLNIKNITKGFYIGTDGVIKESATIAYSDYIRVNEGETYSVSSKVTGYREIQDVNFYSIDKTFLLKTTTRVETTGHATVVAPVGAYYAILNIRNVNIESTELMFYEGSEVLPYTPFTSLTITGMDVDSITANNISKKLNISQTNGRLGDNINFTGDKHPAVLLDFPDSYTKDDARLVSHFNPVTYPEIVQWWQDLVDEFPDYITKKKIGTDSSGTLDVHSYTFTPKKGAILTPNVSPNRDYARVLLLVQHIEHSNQIYPLLAMREICRKWQTDPVLAALRLECEFVVIPYHHPHGLGGGDYRFTSEGLNTNGDWAYNWNHVDDPLNGSAPFATQEARNVKAVIEQFKPHVCMDLHANSHSATKQGIWIDSEANPRYEASVRSAVLSLYPKIVSKWEDTPPINTFYVVTNENANRQFPGYAYAMGATGGLMEFVKDYKGRDKLDGIFNDTLILSSSLLLNIVVQCIAEYRDYGRPNKGELYSGTGIYNPDASN